MMREKTTLDWLNHAKERTSLSLKLEAKDASGNRVIIEWEKSDIRSPRLAEFKRDVSQMAGQVFAPVEVEFLKAHPNAVNQELFLMACAPFFKNGSEDIDWEAVQKQIESTIVQFYLTDLSQFGEEMIKPLLQDIYFLISIKESDTDNLLGFAMFAITPALPEGDIKLINIAIAPGCDQKGLHPLLMGAIFKILPQIERIFLYARPTDERSCQIYCDCGFNRDLMPTQDPNHKINSDYLIAFEYRSEKCHKLQEIANSLTE